MLTLTSSASAWQFRPSATEADPLRPSALALGGGGWYGLSSSHSWTPQSPQQWRWVRGEVAVLLPSVRDRAAVAALEGPKDMAKDTHREYELWAILQPDGSD